MGEAELRLVADILEVVAGHSLAERRGR